MQFAITLQCQYPVQSNSEGRTWFSFLRLYKEFEIIRNMRCKLCQVDKLSREFPREPLTEDCDHPALHCLRCVTKSVRSEWKCPYDGCGIQISPNNSCLKECEDTLEFLFPPVSAGDDYMDCVQDSNSSSSQQTIQVTMLTGEKETFVYNASKTVRQLKTEIQQRTGIETGKQRLIYQDKELKDSEIDNKLSGLGVKPFSTIHLMVMLYAIPENLNHVIFELSWTYPSHGRDFLDASCLMFMQDEWYSFIDWRVKDWCAVTHSGDKMDDSNRKGSQRMEAKLKEIPRAASKLFFTLSSFKAPTIAAFKNPTLRFYDAANDKVQLCEVSFDKPINAQALIVCCVSRQQDGTWKIYEGGQNSAGNAQGYRPLAKTIKQLVRKNHFNGVSLEPGKSLIGYMTPEESRVFKKNCERRLVPGTKNIY